MTYRCEHGVRVGGPEGDLCDICDVATIQERRDEEHKAALDSVIGFVLDGGEIGSLQIADDILCRIADYLRAKDESAAAALVRDAVDCLRGGE